MEIGCVELNSLPFALTPGSHNKGLSWFPDGTKVAFNSTRENNADVWIMDVDINKIRKELKAIN